MRLVTYKIRRAHEREELTEALDTQRRQCNPGSSMQLGLVGVICVRDIAKF